MADDKLQKMVEIAETNISQLFQDDTSMQKFLEFMQKNEHLTYYAASMIDGTDYADTYDGWKERGYQVNAGEHGTPIFVKRSTVKRKFIDENGNIRNLSSASYIERQKIKNGELKVSSNLASYYTVEHLFSKEQTNAKNVDFEVEKRPSILTYEDIKTVVEESTDDILDVDFAMPSPIIKCATGYATYMLCISDNVIDADLYKKAKNEFAEYKDKLSLSEQKLVLNSALKIVRSDHTRELLNVLKNEIRESKKITSSNDVSAQNEPVSEPGDTFVLSNLKEKKEKIKSKNKIEDFGEKIGGARKDLWKQRGLMVDDLKEMNLGEKNKFATKNYIFPKPDYQKMVDEGLPVRTAYFIKTIRDAMPTKPVFSILEDVTDELTEKKIEGYVAFISELKDALLKVKTDDDILNFYDNQIKDVYVKNESTYNVTPTEKSHGCMTNKLLKACQVSRFGLLEFDNKIKKNKFCYTEKQLKYDGFEICKFDDSCAIDEDRGRTVIKRNIGSGTYFYYPEGELADKDSWIKDTYFVLYKNRLIANSLTEGQAQNTVDNMEVQKMNRVELIGRITRDPEIRYSNGAESIAICRFTLAVNRRKKSDDSQEADFINCVAFKGTAEFIEKYLRKGSKIAVCGRIQTGNYTNKDNQKVYTTEVIVQEIEFAESKKEDSDNNGRPEPTDGSGFMNIPDGIEEELPFN